MLGQGPTYTSDVGWALAQQLSQDTSWQQVILSLYNPSHETQVLKDSINKTHTFLQLRNLHKYRHDFHVYDSCDNISGFLTA